MGLASTALNMGGHTSVTAQVLSLVQLATEIPKTFGSPFIYLFFKIFLSFSFFQLACLFIRRMGSLEAQVCLELTIVGEDDLGLLTFPPLPRKYWDYRRVPPYPAYETPCSFHCHDNLGSSISDPVLQMRKAGFDPA